MKTDGQQVKGKQVEDLYDLVTVSREYEAMCERAVTEEWGSLINCRENLGKAALCDDL